MGIDAVMAERTQVEPTMEEIVVALRETTRDADRVLPFAGTGAPRVKRNVRGINEPADVVELRDSEVERLLQENARLNVRVVSLLKILEQQQQLHAEAVSGEAAETSRIEADREAILREARTALEAELAPILMVVLRVLERQRTTSSGKTDRGATRGTATAAARQSPSPWLGDVMRHVDGIRTPNDEITEADCTPRRSKFRELMAQVLNASST
jgi:hypothetical protein